MRNETAFRRWQKNGVNMVMVGSVDGYAVGFDIETWLQVADVFTARKADGTLSNGLRKFHCGKVTGKGMDVAAALKRATVRLYIGKVTTWFEFEDAVARVMHGKVGGHHYNAKLDKIITDKGYDVETDDGRYRIECKGVGGQFARAVYEREEEN